MAKSTKKTAKARSLKQKPRRNVSLVAALRPDPNYVKLLGAATGSQAKA